MPWTSPRTWTTGETVTAAMMNEQVRDNSAYLKDEIEKATIYLHILDDDVALTTGDGQIYFTVPSTLNEYVITGVAACVYTASSSGTPTIQIHNLTDTVDVLSTPITIDATELTSYTAAAAAVINTSNDDLTTGDRLRIDCDVAGTGTKGLVVIIEVEK
jgi:hypothetical protein